ncbi:MAG: insulinase family protein [Planctomycetes bacterium]|nr:insulinase family protein [Planctomycetota bacterium]
MAITFHHRQLPNGLTVLAEIDPDAHTSAVGFFVKTGARDEEKPVMGVSHFLEHMMFKGSARRTADDVNREFDEMGAQYNAFTSHEQTVYYAHILPEFLPRAVDLLGDMLRPALREEDFTVEKKVILEEIGMYEDSPQWRLQDDLVETHFAGHPLGYRVLGTKDSIAALSSEQMRGYFSKRYSPDNMILAAAGRLEIDRLLEDAARVTAQWKPTGTARAYSEPGRSTVDRNVVDPKLTRHYAAAMWAGPSAQDPRRYAARVLTDVIGAPEGSRLYWAMIDPGIADEADCSFLPSDRTGSFVAFLSCDPDKRESIERLFLHTVDHALDALDPDEVERAKNKLATQAMLKSENPAGRMHDLGMLWTYLPEYSPLTVQLERLMAVTPQAVKDLMRDFPTTPRTVARLGPK